MASCLLVPPRVFGVAGRPSFHVRELPCVDCSPAETRKTFGALDIRRASNRAASGDTPQCQVLGCDNAVPSKIYYQRCVRPCFETRPFCF
jgi:hypothetical protein